MMNELDPDAYQAITCWVFVSLFLRSPSRPVLEMSQNSKTCRVMVF